MNERLGKLSSDTTKAVAGAEIGSREKLSNDQIKARMAELEKSTDSAERIAKMDTDSRKDIQTLQAEAAQQLGIKPMLGADGKTQVWVRPDGTKVDGPKDANGNEISLAAADTDTDEMKNIKFLMTTGNMTFERAQETILAAKNTDSKLMRLGLFRAMVGNSLVPPTEEELQTKWDLSGTFQKKMEAQEAAGTPAADATTASPDTPAPAASATAPQQLTSAEKKQVIADAKIAIKPKSEGGLGISPVKIIQELQEKYGISRVEAGL